MFISLVELGESGERPAERRITLIKGGPERVRYG